MKIRVHNSRYLPSEGVLTAELHVRHLLGDHYEIWRGSPWHWATKTHIKLTRKRRRVLNREYKRRLREWEEDTR